MATPARGRFPAIWQPPRLGIKTPFAGRGLLGARGARQPAFTPTMRSQLLGRPGPQVQTGGGGGGNPYAGVLQDYLNQVRADTAAEGAADKGNMINALRQYAISYGKLPEGDMWNLSGPAAGYWKEALDPRTRELAAKAEAEGISSHARLSRENAVAMRRIPAQLAARGILSSGQTQSDFGDQAQTFKNQGYDMLSSLLQGVTGAVSNFQEAERARQRALAEAQMQAAFQASQDWGDSYFNEGATGASSAANIRALRGGSKAPGPVIRGKANRSRVSRRPIRRSLGYIPRGAA